MQRAACWLAKKLLAMLVLLVLCACCSAAAEPAHSLDRLLAAARRDVPHLHVLLRRNQLQLDAANENVRWFLQLRDMPHYVHSYDAHLSLAGTAAHLQLTARDNVVLVVGLAQLLANGGAVSLTKRSGGFFYILGDQVGALSQQQLLQLEQSSRHLWMDHRIYNRYIITDAGIWVYDPFAGDAQSAQNELSFGRLRLYEGGEPLARQLFHNMHGYPLRIQIFRSVYARPVMNSSTGKLRYITGADWEVASQLSKVLNFTMQLQEPDKNYFGERSPNGTYNGAIGSLINDDVDICLTGFFVKDYLVPDLMDFSVTVYDDQLCIYVPKARRIPQSILPIFAVGYEIWLGFILMAFGCALVWLLLRLINLQLRIVSSRGMRLWQHAMCIVVDTWVVWVRVNLSHLPASYAERLFIGSLFLVSVIFGAIFESSLATVYIHPLHYKDIMTMRDLDESGLRVVYKFSSMADDLFFSETSPLFASLNKKLQWNQNLNADVTTEVATMGGKAGVSRFASLIMESSGYLLRNQIWIIPECPKYYTISYVLPRDAPWEEMVNAQLLQMLSAGLIEKWIRDQKDSVNIKKRIFLAQNENTDSEVRVLTINDLQLAFYVVLGGTSLAWLSFLIEHVWTRCRSAKRTL